MFAISRDFFELLEDEIVANLFFTEVRISVRIKFAILIAPVCAEPPRKAVFIIKHVSLCALCLSSNPKPNQNIKSGKKPSCRSKKCGDY